MTTRPAPSTMPATTSGTVGGRGSETSPASPPARDGVRIGPRQLLRVRRLWTVPVLVGSIMLVLISGVYIASVVNPVGHLHGLPVAIVNQDTGATVAGRHVALGAELQSGLIGSGAVASRLSLIPERLSRAQQRMNHDGAYATLVIPRNFTASLLGLTGANERADASPGRPTVKVLANRRAGTVGVELASGVLQPALARASQRIGRQLLSAARPAPASSAAAVLADPITVSSVDYRPLRTHSALGLSAFYIALLTIMSGFLAGTIIQAAVDAATGYATSELGPRWHQRPPLPISRRQTLLTKWAMALPITGLLTALMLGVAVGLLGMDAPDVGVLWLFTWLAAAAVAAGTLALFAALGTQGQLVALLLFVYLGLASAGGTVPLQALPAPLHLLSQIEPLRQILAGTRAILYYGAAGDAGLTRGLIAALAGLIIWLAAGTAITTFYDRKGFYRMRPDVLAYVHRAINAHHT